MGFGVAENFYGDQASQDFTNLSNLQSNQSLGYGDQAANYADPFMDERQGYQNQLRRLMRNPGSFSKSPAYKFAFDQGMNALQRKGSVRSGSKLAELMKYGQGMASQLYGQQAQLLSNLAMSGSSPAAAGLAYSRGTERSQDYRQMGAAANAMGKPTGGAPGGYGSNVPAWMQSGPLLPPRSDPYAESYYSGNNTYSPGSWTGAGGPSGYGGYTPSSQAGTGGMSVMPGGGYGGVPDYDYSQYSGGSYDAGAYDTGGYSEEY